jgi:hypothetical protein
MILTPMLRKTLTVCLLLPIGLAANSSLADCPSDADKMRLAKAHEAAAVEFDRKDAHGRHRDATPARIVKGGRLSRVAFFGDEQAAAIVELNDL